MDKLAGEIRFGLEESHPGMRKTILKKLPLAVSAMIQARMLNTMARQALEQAAVGGQTNLLSMDRPSWAIASRC
ncbi:MAG TPA: hypothetical protein PKY22_04590 [Accumulibacter sp.]|nr:hypothetical protein [Accumulibacter sp.]